MGRVMTVMTDAEIKSALASLATIVRALANEHGYAASDSDHTPREIQAAWVEVIGLSHMATS